MTLEPILFEAESYLERGDLDRAAVLFRCAHQLCSGRSELPAVGLSRVALMLGQVDEARAILADVRRRHPQSGPAALIWAAVEELTRPMPEALPAFELAVSLAPKAWVSHFNLGRALAQLKRFEEAVGSFSRAKTLSPRQTAVMTQLAAALVGLKRYDEAIAVLVEAVAIAPTQLDPTLCLVDALAASGRTSDAQRMISDAAKRFPTSPEVLSKRASLALRSGDAATARRCVREQLKHDDSDFEAWLFCGVLALGQLDVVEATDCALKARALKPESSRPWVLLAQAKECVSAKEAALDAYLEAARLEAHAWEARVNAAVLLLETGKATVVEQAARLLNEASRHVPPNEVGRVKYNQALAAARAGQLSAAKEFAVQAQQGGQPDAGRLVSALETQEKSVLPILQARSSRA